MNRYIDVVLVGQIRGELRGLGVHRLGEPHLGLVRVALVLDADGGGVETGVVPGDVLLLHHLRDLAAGGIQAVAYLADRAPIALQPRAQHLMMKLGRHPGIARLGGHVGHQVDRSLREAEAGAIGGDVAELRAIGPLDSRSIGLIVGSQQLCMEGG